MAQGLYLTRDVQETLGTRPRATIVFIAIPSFSVSSNRGGIFGRGG